MAVSLCTRHANHGVLVESLPRKVRPVTWIRYIIYSDIWGKCRENTQRCSIQYCTLWYKFKKKQLFVLRLRYLQVAFHQSAGRMGENERWLPTPILSPYSNWVKKCLSNYAAPQPDMEHAILTDPATHHSICSRKLLIVAFLALMALAVMGLLLFWNYQCIFVWHLCYEDNDISGASGVGGEWRPLWMKGREQG